MVDKSRCLWRVFSAYPRLVTTSTSFRFLCQRNLNQAQASEARKLHAMVVGLGNYILPDTRHSVGMLVVDCLSKRLGAVWQFNKKLLGHSAVTKMNDRQLILFKPGVAMNINGRSIGRAATMFDVNPSNIVLVHDDLDKALGKFSFKNGGSAGGHNGVRSAIASLRCDLMTIMRKEYFTTDYLNPRMTIKRVRIGIGRPRNRHDVTAYVLSEFDPSEIPVMQDTVDKCCEALMNELQSLMSQNSPNQDKERGDTGTARFQVQV